MKLNNTSNTGNTITSNGVDILKCFKECKSLFKPVNSKSILYKDNVIIYRDDSNRFMKSAKMRSLEYNSLQQCFLIYHLVKMGYTINIAKIYKKSKISRQTFRIKKIIKGNQIKFDENFILSCEEYNFSGDMRKKRKNLNGIANNTMLILLECENCHFKCKDNRLCDEPSMDKPEYIKRLIWFETSQIKYSKEDIKRIGKRIYDDIRSKVINCDYEYSSIDIIGFDLTFN